MAGTIKRLAGPLALTTVITTNVFNAASALIGSIIRHIHIENKTASAAVFTLYLGASAGNVAGTELFFQVSIQANGTYDYYCALLMLSTDFLVGGAGTTLALTITIEGEQYVV